jgi:hypothetical protein
VYLRSADGADPAPAGGAAGLQGAGERPKLR